MPPPSPLKSILLDLFARGLISETELNDALQKLVDSPTAAAPPTPADPLRPGDVSFVLKQELPWLSGPGTVLGRAGLMKTWS
jgi:hypothetical protein